MYLLSKIEFIKFYSSDDFLNKWNILRDFFWHVTKNIPLKVLPRMFHQCITIIHIDPVQKWLYLWAYPVVTLVRTMYSRCSLEPRKADCRSEWMFLVIFSKPSKIVGTKSVWLKRALTTSSSEFSSNAFQPPDSI